MTATTPNPDFHNQENESPTAPRARATTLKIQAYVPGRHSVSSHENPIILSANENCLGCSEAASRAYQNASSQLFRYPDGSASALRSALGSLHAIDSHRIVCGNGSDELLHLLPQAFMQPGDEAIYSRHGFLVYKIATLAAGGTPVIVEEDNLTASVDNYIAAITPRTKVVFLANPNNPTGTMLPMSEIERLHKALPSDVLLVLDAAYAEFVDDEEYDPGFAMVNHSQNVVMTRTFSKIYGLAGLRIGWMYGPAGVVDVINRIRGPFNLSVPAIAAAVAAIKDQGFVERSQNHNSHWRKWLHEKLSSIGLRIPHSQGNFLLLQFPDKYPKMAAEADSFLGSHGVILRAMGGYNLPNALRLTVGLESENTRVVELLSSFMRQSPASSKQ